MYTQKVKFYAACLALAVGLAACGGNAASTEQSAEPVISQPTATSAPAAPTDTPAPVAAESNPANSPELAQIVAVEEAASINSYRMHVSMRMNDARGSTIVELHGDFVKEPAAEHLTIEFDENGEVQQVEMVVADGARYMQAGGMWVQAPEMGMNIDELTLITAADVAEANSGFAQIGEETVNGRTTVHYRGDKNSLPVAGTAGDTFDLSRADDAQVDLWIDQAEHFIVKLQISGSDGPSDTFELLIEYLDFNQPITINAPEAAALTPPASEGNEPPAEAGNANAELRTDLGAVLGFDLMLPTGSEVTLATDQMVQVTTPYTLDEAVNLFQQNMPNNGYTLMNQLAPEAGQTVLMYQQGQKIVTINLTAVAENQTRWDVVAAP